LRPSSPDVSPLALGPHIEGVSLPFTLFSPIVSRLPLLTFFNLLMSAPSCALRNSLSPLGARLSLLKGTFLSWSTFSGVRPHRSRYSVAFFYLLFQRHRFPICALNLRKIHGIFFVLNCAPAVERLYFGKSHLPIPWRLFLGYINFPTPATRAC